MTDQERILKLLEDGKISTEQAEGLLEALDEADSAGLKFGDLALVPSVQELDSGSKEGSLELSKGRYSEIIASDRAETETTKAEIIDDFVTPVPPAPPLPPLSPLPPLPPISPPQSKTNPQSQTNDVPQNLTWLTVKTSSGDVNIQVDPDIDVPIVEGDDGPLPVYSVNNGQGKMSIESLDTDLDITLPENYGVILEVKSGDVSIEDCFVTGKVLSGDVSLENITGLQLTVMSGDVDGNLKLTKGTHSLEVMSGDVSLIFQEGSSLSFRGNVQAGEATISHSKGDLNHEDMSFEGKVAEGEAQLSLEVQSGDLNIDIEAESSSVTSNSRATKKTKGDKHIEINFDFDFSFANKLNEPKDLRWLAIRSLSGNVILKTEPGLHEPKVLNGKKLKQKDNGEYGIYSLMGNVEVLLPEDYGVRLDVMAGNLEAHGAAYVRGRVWAGNAELTMVRGVNLVVMSGNAEAELLLTDAEHNLEVWAGNAEVEVLKGSSVVAKATVPVGDVNAKTSNVKYEPLGNKSFRATMGDGKAQLNLSVKTGNLDFEANNV
jgi:DUF4097 and DUF4098 domain-containing protein YvlB